MTAAAAAKGRLGRLSRRERICKGMPLRAKRKGCMRWSAMLVVCAAVLAMHEGRLPFEFFHLKFVSAHEASPSKSDIAELDSSSSSSDSSGNSASFVGILAKPKDTKTVIDPRIVKLREADLPKVSWPISGGWTKPENNKFRNYLCRFGELSTPCWDTLALFPILTWKDYPSPIFCPPGTCCGSYLSLVTCQRRCYNGGWKTMAADRCTCATHGFMCPKNAVCDDTDRNFFGGTFCRCKDGYVGNGLTCYPDPCADESKNMCYPGTCEARPNGEAYCLCPEGYVWDDTIPDAPKCILSDMCENDPCGEPAAVLECHTGSPLQYTCVCRSGYAVKMVDGASKCMPEDNSVKCVDEPCGTEGLLSCIDAPSGPQCLCQKDYRLVANLRKKACVFSPCDREPCGDAVAVKSCTAGISTYTCVCNDKFKLDTVDGLPRCVKAEQDYFLLFLGTGVAAVGLLVSIGSCFILRSRMLRRTALENFRDDQVANIMGTMQDGIRFDASEWR